MQTQLSRRDYEAFLVHLYFGPEAIKAPLAVCIRRAYSDFQRTLRGIATLSDKDRIKDEAVRSLGQRIEAIRNRAETVDQAGFDRWHQDTCAFVQTIYKKAGFADFHIGQSQKWLNMTFKYIHTLGEERIPGFQSLYNYCHVPFDNIMIIGLKRFHFPNFDQPWSQIDDYGEYLNRQKWIRHNIAIPPLDFEFRLWMNPDAEIPGVFPA